MSSDMGDNLLPPWYAYNDSFGERNTVSEGFLCASYKQDAQRHCRCAFDLTIYKTISYSVGSTGFAPLYTTGALLGHRDVKSTARYGHLADDPLKRAADATAGMIAARLEGRAGSVVSIRRTRRHSA